MRIPALLSALALVGVLLTGPAHAEPEVIDRVVAVVNKDIVLLSQLDETMAEMEPSELRGLVGAEREQRRGQLAKVVLDGLINEQLVEQAMRRSDITVEDREVEQAIADVANQNDLTLETLEQELGRQGVIMSDYRHDIRDQLKQYKFTNLEIRGRVQVDETDVLNRYNQLKADADPDPQWRLRRIMLQYPADEAGKAAVRDEAGRLLTAIQGGQPFAAAARARSDDTSTRERGGDAGLVRPAELAPAFSDALSVVEPGTPVLVDTPAAAFLVQVDGVENGSVKPYEEVKGELMRQLYDEAMEREMKLWTAEERRKAHVEVLY